MPSMPSRAPFTRPGLFETTFNHALLVIIAFWISMNCASSNPAETMIAIFFAESDCCAIDRISFDLLIKNILSAYQSHLSR